MERRKEERKGGRGERREAGRGEERRYKDVLESIFVNFSEKVASFIILYNNLVSWCLSVSLIEVFLSVVLNDSNCERLSAYLLLRLLGLWLVIVPIS